MSNLEFERDVIIYTDSDINIKTELAEPIQVSFKRFLENYTVSGIRDGTVFRF